MDLATDGLPLFKSASQIKLWPIMGSFPNLKNIQPFLIGAHVGKKDPQSSDIFLRELCAELTEIKSLGGIFFEGNAIPKPLHIRLFTCDAPARAFICNVKSHSSKFGCSKCDQEGSKPTINSGVIYSSTISNSRTDESLKKSN